MAKFTFFYGNQPYSFKMLEIPKEEVKYDETDVSDQLRFKQGTNEIRFRYDLLDGNEMKKKTLDTVISGSISMAAFAQVKRTAQFKMTDDKDIDWLNDRIQPYAMLKMPDGSWVEWSLGIFILSAPNRVENDGGVFRDVEAYDGLIILKDDKFLDRYRVEEGTKYISAIHTILGDAGVKKINIEDTDSTLNKDIEFEPGTEKLAAINELLDGLNWNTLWVDEDGYYTSNRYQSPANRTSTQRYYDDELSITLRGMSEELDLTEVANSWVAVASNPEEEPLFATYRNDNPDSPTSTVSRGRVIADFRELDSISSQEALQERVERYAFNASQVYGYLKFDTAINPMHTYSDVLEMRNDDMEVLGAYAETHWTMPLEAGAKMSHEVRKVVYI